MDRASMLKEILERNPNDAFARYGLALEYASTGQTGDALREFEALLQAHPEYTAGYFMAAQTLAHVDRIAEARQMLLNGIASAQRTGNHHARDEMQAMLAELEAA
jgi:tetratricopeptide (TPR) repeat protein